MPDLREAQMWADAITLDMDRTGYPPAHLVQLGIERGHMCNVALDLTHPEVDLERCVVVSHAGWVVAYDHGTKEWTAR